MITKITDPQRLSQRINNALEASLQIVTGLLQDARVVSVLTLLMSEMHDRQEASQAALPR